MAGTAVAAVIAGVLGGAALNVAGRGGGLAVPLAALAALRVLEHAADRTLPDAGRQRDEGPGGSGGDTGGGPDGDGPDHPSPTGAGAGTAPHPGSGRGPDRGPDAPGPAVAGPGHRGEG